MTFVIMNDGVIFKKCYFEYYTDPVHARLQHALKLLKHLKIWYFSNSLRPSIVCWANSSKGWTGRKHHHRHLDVCIKSNCRTIYSQANLVPYLDQYGYLLDTLVWNNRPVSRHTGVWDQQWINFLFSSTILILYCQMRYNMIHLNVSHLINKTWNITVN